MMGMLKTETSQMYNFTITYPEKREAFNKTVLRNIKIDIALGDIELSPDKSRVDWKTWCRCKILSRKGFIIGGSVCLKLYGLLDRKTDDFDLFKGDHIFTYGQEEFSPYPGEEDDGVRRGKVSNRWLGDMDIFKKDVDYITYRGVKLANPLNSFTAKMGYNRLKDYRDFEVLNEKYKNMLIK